MTLIASFNIGALRTLPTISSVAQQPGFFPVAAALAPSGAALAPGGCFSLACTSGPGSVVNVLLYVVAGPLGGAPVGYAPAIPLPPLAVGGAAITFPIFTGTIGSVFRRALDVDGPAPMPLSWASFAQANPNLNVPIAPGPVVPGPGMAALGGFLALARGEMGPYALVVSQ